jgi:protein-tyrosine phosphatase
MSHRAGFILIGLLLLATGLWERGWMLLLAWWGGDFVALGIAHALGAHRLFGKRPDGSLPLWSWLVFLPMLLFSLALWQVLRMVCREPAQNAVTDQLVIGRRLAASEVAGKFDNYVDLTAEFAEPAAIRRGPCYRSFPILDGGAPTPDALARALDSLKPGSTFVHCAQGHGRAALFGLAYLLKSGQARTVDEGFRILRQARPAVCLSRPQRACIEAFAQQLNHAPPKP